jgi:hypothetical protein
MASRLVSEMVHSFFDSGDIARITSFVDMAYLGVDQSFDFGNVGPHFARTKRRVAEFVSATFLPKTFRQILRKRRKVLASLLRRHLRIVGFGVGNRFAVNLVARDCRSGFSNHLRICVHQSYDDVFGG